MVCELPKNCQSSTYQYLPELQAGETVVQSFEGTLDAESNSTSSESNSTSLLAVPLNVELHTAIADPGNKALRFEKSFIILRQDKVKSC
jgi:hypothetical protein